MNNSISFIVAAVILGLAIIAGPIALQNYKLSQCVSVMVKQKGNKSKDDMEVFCLSFIHKSKY